jgi:hypothetical protein
MMRKVLLSLAILIFGLNYAFAQTDSIRHRIFLVGDAGSLLGNKHPVIDWMRSHINWEDERNTVLFIGDNIYPYGMPSEGEPLYNYSKSVIDYQINLVKGTKSKAYFVMGNHDWKNGKIGGWEQAMNEVDYINGLLLSNVHAYPTGGCPGPEVVELDTLVVLALMDSQWFLHTHDKPGPGSSCASKSIDEFSTELTEAVESHPNQLMILALHHPLETFGVHGGTTYTLKHHIFPLTELNPNLYIPLPIIGSIYPIARGIFGNIQDVNHPLYRSMANTIEEVITKHPNPIVVSGHDHSLQLLRLKKDSVYQVVSGSGVNLSNVNAKTKNKDLIFAHHNYGFSVLEVTKSGKVSIKYYDIESKDFSSPIFSKELLTIKRSLPPGKVDSLKPLPSSITIAADKELSGNAISKFLVGTNYRKEWVQPVTVPVFDIGHEQGGMKPIKKGGGKQTKSLQLEDKEGKNWALRSIQKFPEAAIPADLRQSFARDIVKQGISASYPYGPLSIETFARAAGIPTIRRKLVYVPDDPRLDRFRTEFSNSLAILEEREPLGVKKTDNTEELVLRLQKDNDDHVDQVSVLKARLVDNFIMDFDRHEDQWRWATRDTGKGKLYFAIPRDHDQAFFKSDGLIPMLMAKPWFVPELQGFRANAKNIKTFNRPARNFDRFFLTGIDEKTWSMYVDSFLHAMTDDVIETAMHQQPAEIHSLHMNQIIEKLKKRREYFKGDMMEYYKFISQKVNVVGSNQREQFTITKNDDGSVHVISNKIDKDEKVTFKLYERTFDPHVTKEIMIYGLGGEDRFIIEGGYSPIRIRLIGGSGNDEFINNGGHAKVMLYDAVFEKNVVSGNPGIINKISKDPQVNRYNRFDFKYNYVSPSLSAAYNIDDGIFLGAHVEVLRQGFRKEPYKNRQYISGVRAFKTGALRFKYEGDWIGLIGHEDLIMRGDFRAPVNVTNFFGYGNESVFVNNTKDDELFYRVRYNFIDFSMLMRRQLQSWMRVNYGLGYQFFDVETKSNKGKFVSMTPQNGLDSATLYKAKSFLGAHLKLDINSKNNKALPTRGFTMDLNIRPMFGLTNESHNILKTDIDMRVYASLFNFPRLVLATRVGWGKNYGKFDFPQAYYLGGTENLRGYRRDRFAGRSMLFNNTEIRIRVVNFNTYLFPGSLGLLVFNDVGRVWMDHENSKDWHVGNGVGLWVAPIQRFVFAFHLTRSKEEKAMPYVSFGYQF